MNIYQPYTYLIGWSDLNTWYYGVRYSKYAKPSDLWVTYFTSSKYVKLFRKKHGEPNVIQIRKIFDDKHKAILWEQKVLKRIDVQHDKRFLNVKNDTTKTPIIGPNSGSFKKGHKTWNKNLDIKSLLDEEARKKFGRKFTDEEKHNLSVKNKKIFGTIERREQARQKTLDQFNDSVKKEYHKSKCVSHKDKIWINDGLKNKRIKEKDLINFFGWMRGRLIPKEKIELMINNRVTLRDKTTGRFLKHDKKGD